jgi:hypothetical protein
MRFDRTDASAVSRCIHDFHLGITLQVSCALLEMLIATPLIPGFVCHTFELDVSA